MTPQHDTSGKPPGTPQLTAPREEAVIDGAAVTFRWDPSEGATAYLLEVASDPAFKTILFEQVTAATALAVADRFPADGATYYWRVIARNEAGESYGEVIESFISGTPAAVARHFMRPDHEERLGPLPELITGGSKDVLYVHSLSPSPPDPDVGRDVADVETFYAVEDAVGFQREYLEIRQVLGVYALFFFGLALLVAFAFAWARFAAQETQAARASEATYPALREVELRATRQLNRYAVLDAERGIYQIPVDHAIDLIVSEADPSSDRGYSSR